MDAIIQAAIRQNDEAAKPESAVPWKPDEPHAQPFYTYDGAKQAWEAAECKPAAEAAGARGVARLALFSWNIDFMLPCARERMDAALEHLGGLVSQLAPDTAAVIFLQECVASDLQTIGEKPWVREKFHATDVDPSNWATRYGTTTLVDRRLDLTACFRVHYRQTRMQRDAFFVDVAVVPGGDISSSNKKKTIRLCNTHLESLALSPPLRPAQMQLAASYMRAAGVDGALAAGDFNAIQPSDRGLHAANGLRDAYLERGGREDADGGCTWGQQAATTLRDRFGCSRMDKVYLTAGDGDPLRLQDFRTFGADVQVAEPALRERIVGLGFEKPWITDHLGIVATVEVV
ncbi:Endonuclease/exonuclease/phosphatase [Hypoxylon sp. FL1284]|nr:Endonuclease/exonuclease/phosphatase [Hypoxylon sp. FL1284]